jgi:glycosyltransferase involved in cell wall biosynthesis
MVITRTPRVSVVMPVHNALPYLDAAVESILRQTFDDFEFVILDDASTDGSTERLRYWSARDARIRLLEVDRNLGPARSSERVARTARAPIVARMDADDISYPERLADQVKVLDRYPDVGVVGGLFDIINPEGRIVRGAEPWRLKQPASVPPFGNGPLTYRHEVFDQVGGYREECEFWEDNDLILRMAAVTRIMVLPYSIYQVRQARVSNRLSSEQQRVERAVDLMYRARKRLEQNQSYEDLLRSGLADDRKVDPQVFVSLGSITLWAGGRPRLFKRLLSRGALGYNRRSLAALVWTAWASAEPHTLRAFIRLLLLGRKVRTSAKVRTADPVLWPALRTSIPTPAVSKPSATTTRRAFKVTYTAKAAEAAEALSPSTRRRSE